LDAATVKLEPRSERSWFLGNRDELSRVVMELGADEQVRRALDDLFTAITNPR